MQDFLYLVHITLQGGARVPKMAADYVSMLLADLSTTHYAVAVAVLLGLPGVLYLLCCALRGAKKPQETAEDSGSEEQVNADGGQKQKKQQQAKVKGTKIKPQRKITLPSHPLLAAEFRGHTGSVLSLDFDDNGKYLASCSEGQSWSCSQPTPTSWRLFPTWYGTGKVVSDLRYGVWG